MFFARPCVVCRNPSGPVCKDCCGRLNRIAGDDVDGLLTGADKTLVDRCRVGFVLDDTSRPIVAALKYRQQRRLAAWFAEQTAALVPRAADVLTWIPATPARRQQRGFDQAQQIALQLGKRSGVPVQRLLARRAHDDRQTGRSRSQRVAGPAVHGCTAAPPFVVVVDDVVTTGSSLRRAAAGVRAHGAERVVGLVMTATPSPVELLGAGSNGPRMSA